MELIRKIFQYINWLYVQYSLVTALNILDAFERYIFNTFVVLILFVFTYSTYLYLPSQLRMFSNLFNKLYS